MLGRIAMSSALLQSRVAVGKLLLTLPAAFACLVTRPSRLPVNDRRAMGPPLTEAVGMASMAVAWIEDPQAANPFAVRAATFAAQALSHQGRRRSQGEGREDILTAGDLD